MQRLKEITPEQSSDGNAKCPLCCGPIRALVALSTQFHAPCNKLATTVSEEFETTQLLSQV